MRSGKLKSVMYALLAALTLAALVFGFAFANDKAAYADSADGLSSSGYEGENFVYSAEFTPANDEAAEAGLVFGMTDNGSICYTAAVGLADGKVMLSHSEEGELKTADCGLKAGEKFKLTVVMNGGIAKVFVNNDSVAAICCKLESYSGGKLGLYVGSGDFEVSNVRFTDTELTDGNIYCNGYKVLKVVNITDGNYKLADSEYTVDGGTLTVADKYLKTLEADTEYLFRVVTSFTDFDFKVMNDFTAVTATPAVEKYYRNNEVTLELSGNVKVNKVLIDGKECAFRQAEDAVTISSEVVSELATGKHSVKLYTDKGRPETSITVSEIVETVSEPVVKSSHLFFWIDIAIFAGAIIAYGTYSFISKRKSS